MTRKLHIGCGKCYLPGFKNVDIFSSVHADIYADMTALPFEPATFDLIYASHVLEHSHRHMVLATLAHWRELLCAGGILRLAVPDFAACCDWYNKYQDLASLIGLLYGGQNHPKNNHFIIFDYQSLTEALRIVGFNHFRRWNWKSTEHAEFDDYSQAYLPKMEKERGELMSLNIEAIK